MRPVTQRRFFTTKRAKPGDVVTSIALQLHRKPDLPDFGTTLQETDQTPADGTGMASAAFAMSKGKDRKGPSARITGMKSSGGMRRYSCSCWAALSNFAYLRKGPILPRNGPLGTWKVASVISFQREECLGSEI